MNLSVVFLIALCLACGSAQTSSEKRNSSGEETKKEPECPGRLPCGWLVYNKSTRVSEFFMNNTCVCPPGKSCLKSDDMLSAGAYVYRCFENIRAIKNHKIENLKLNFNLVKGTTSQNLDTTTALTTTPFTVKEEEINPLPSNNDIRRAFYNLFQYILPPSKFRKSKNKCQED